MTKIDASPGANMETNREMDMDIDMDIEYVTLLDGHPEPTHTTTRSTSTSKRRVILPQEAHGSITTRTSHDEVILLEVDHMILDYLMYQAIAACVANAHEPDAAAVDQALLQVSDFRQLFHTRHPDYTFDNELRFRQLLLQLIALMTSRFVPHHITPPPASLDALRARNSARARAWIETASRMPTANHDPTDFETVLPLERATLYTNRTNSLFSFRHRTETSETEFYGRTESVSLLDILPLFMRVSAAACETLFAGNINDQWMLLASQWMMQACLEQYLIYGMSGRDVVDEAFAWGYKRGKDAAGEAGEDQPEYGSVNAMFEDSQYAREVDGWSQLKEECLNRLLSHGDEDVRGHLARLSELSPMTDFVGSALQFLKSLSKSIPEPVLVQLEKGELDGFTKQATTQFLKDCGVGDRELSAML